MARAAPTRTSEHDHGHQGGRKPGPPHLPQLSGLDQPAQDPESLRETQGRITHTLVGPAVTAIQTITGFLAPLGATSAS